MFNKVKGATKGSRKMIIGLGLVVGVSVAYSYLTAPEPVVTPSNLGAPPVGAVTIQGGNQVPKAYDDALAMSDKGRIDEARNAGTSAIPTIRANPSEQMIPVISLDPVVTDPPEIQLPEIKAPVIIQSQAQTIPIVQPPQPIRDPEEANKLAQYIRTVKTPYPVAEVVRLSNGDVEVAKEEQTAPYMGDLGVTDQATASKVVLPLSGTILYAEMISRANSDTPGPVLARVLQGEYTGATLIGSFQTVRNALIVSFTKMTVTTTRDGREINETVPIETVAVDTKYIGTGLASSVDRHMFQKLAIGFTSSMAEGFGDALANNGSTTIVTEGGSTISSRPELNTKEQLISAGGKAVSNAGGILMDEFGRRPTTIIVDSGTAIGVLFL